MQRNFVTKGYRVFGSVRKRKDADRVKTELGDRFEPLLFDVTNHTAVQKGADLVSNQVSKGWNSLADKQRWDCDRGTNCLF